MDLALRKGRGCVKGNSIFGKFSFKVDKENRRLGARKSCKLKYVTQKQRFYAVFSNKKHRKYYKKRYSNTVKVEGQ